MSRPLFRRRCESLPLRQAAFPLCAPRTRSRLPAAARIYPVLARSKDKPLPADSDALSNPVPSVRRGPPHRRFPLGNRGMPSSPVFQSGLRSESTSEIGVYQHDHRRMLVVALRETSAALDGNSHRLVVSLRHQIEQRKRHVSRTRRLRSPFHPKRYFRIACHRKCSTLHGNCFHTRHALQLTQSRAVFISELARTYVRGGGR